MKDSVGVCGEPGELVKGPFSCLQCCCTYTVNHSQFILCRLQLVEFIFQVESSVPDISSLKLNSGESYPVHMSMDQVEDKISHESTLVHIIDVMRVRAQREREITFSKE